MTVLDGIIQMVLKEFVQKDLIAKQLLAQIPTIALKKRSDQHQDINHVLVVVIIVSLLILTQARDSQTKTGQSPVQVVQNFQPFGLSQTVIDLNLWMVCESLIQAVLHVMKDITAQHTDRQLLTRLIIFADMDLYVTKEQIVQHHMREYVPLDRIVMVAQAQIVPLEQLVQHCTVQ